MSSLVHKQRQQAVVGAEGGSDDRPEEQQNDNASCQKFPTQFATSAKKGLQRSVSFEKLMVTACHIRLACSKCSREALKLCLELLILRSRLLAQQLIAVVLANLIHVSLQWNHKFLDISKWQTRARHIADATVLQRQWRHREMKTASNVIPANHNKSRSSVTESKRREVAEKNTEIKMANNDNFPKLRDTEPLENAYAEDKCLRQGLTFAVTLCAILLGMQVVLGLALLLQMINKTPWELYFLVICVGYIGYLLQTIFNYDRLTRTTYNFGEQKTTPRASKDGMKHKYLELERPDEKEGKVIHLSFIERTMSKVKLL